MTGDIERCGEEVTCDGEEEDSAQMCRSSVLRCRSVLTGVCLWDRSLTPGGEEAETLSAERLGQSGLSRMTNEFKTDPVSGIGVEPLQTTLDVIRVCASKRSASGHVVAERRCCFGCRDSQDGTLRKC